MKKYFFTTQISKKLRSINELPEWLSSYPDFKDQVKLLRETLGMTQKQLAKMVNKSLRSIQLIESGRAMPKITTLHKIANVLNTELKITLIPRQNIIEFLNERAAEKARQLVKIDTSSSALEVQSPSDEETNEQIEALKKDILEKRRDRLWDQDWTKR